MALNAAAWKIAIIFSMESDGRLDGLTETEKDSIESAWNIVCEAHVNHIKNNAAVSTTGTTGSGSPGGPLPIVAQPGVVS